MKSERDLSRRSLELLLKMELHMKFTMARQGSSACSRIVSPQIVIYSLSFVLACGGLCTALAQEDDTDALKALLKNSNGGVARLQANKVYHIHEKLELKTLCPDGIVIEGNNAVIKAAQPFRHGVLLTGTELLRNEPYDPGTTIRHLALDGNGCVGRCVFGNWKNARIHDLQVKGGTDYQVNAVWNNSTLSNIQIAGNATQTNNGFDCNLQDTVIWNIRVDMNDNLKECGLWLNGAKNAKIINAYLTDGRSAFGLENCQDVDLINLIVRGRFSFRVVNILPADPSERIHLYNVNIQAEHVGSDASAGIHFNATKGGLVARGTIATSGPGVMLSNGASDVDVIDVDLPSREVHPAAEWTRDGPRTWLSKNRQVPGALNRCPVVYVGPDRNARNLANVMLVSAVADECDASNLMMEWSKVSGPGDVQFGAASAKTNASFSEGGVYTLRLRAYDGKLEGSDDVTIRVGIAD